MTYAIWNFADRQSVVSITTLRSTCMFVWLECSRMNLYDGVVMVCCFNNFPESCQGEFLLWRSMYSPGRDQSPWERRPLYSFFSRGYLSRQPGSFLMIISGFEKCIKRCQLQEHPLSLSTIC